MSEDAAKVALPVLKNGDFPTFARKFVAFATIKKFAFILTDDSDLPVSGLTTRSSLKPDVDAEMLKIKAIDANELAMAYLNLTISEENGVRCLRRSVTPLWPNGKATKAWQYLKDKYVPTNTTQQTILRNELKELKMRDNDDPKSLFEKIYKIETRWHESVVGTTLSQNELISQVLMAAPEYYSKILIDEQRKKGSTCTCEDLQECMQDYFDIAVMKGTIKPKAAGYKEIALAGVDADDDRACYKCGKRGHIARNCPERKKGGDGGGGHRQNNNNNNNKKKFDGNCHLCGKKGHRKADCWELEENASRRPKNWKSSLGQEQGNAGLGTSAGSDSNADSSIEFMLASSDWELVSDGDDLEILDVDEVYSLEFDSDWEDGGLEAVLMASDDDATTSGRMTFGSGIEILDNPNMFVGDTAATLDCGPHEHGLRNARAAAVNENMATASGDVVTGTMTGELPVEICNRYGNSMGTACLPEYTVMPGAKYNLFSLSKRLEEGWNLGGDSDSIWLEKEGRRITFNIKVKTKKGLLFCIYLRRTGASDVACPAVETDKIKVEDGEKPISLSIKLAHDILGHMGEAKCRAIASHFEWKLTRGKLKACGDCMTGKQKQKRVHKSPAHKPADVPNGRVYLDLSKLQAPDALAKKVTVNRPYWRMMVDDFSGLKFSEFFATKNGMVNPTCELMHKWSVNNKPVKLLRMDNAGENLALVQKANGSEWKLNITPEYTAKSNPQPNSKVETGFDIIRGRGIAAMSRANVPKELRYKLASECMKTMTLLDGLVIVELNGVKMTRFEHWGGSIPRFAKIGNLRTWGEAGAVRTKTKTTPKLFNRADHCMFVGYNLNHAGDVWRMWHPGTNRIHKTRDVIWLKRMYFERNPEAPTFNALEMEDPEPPNDEAGKDDAADNLLTASDQEDEYDDDDDDDSLADMPGLAPRNADDSDDEDEDDDDDASSVESRADPEPEPVRTTRSGRTICRPERFREELGNLCMSHEEQNYYAALMNLSCMEYDDSINSMINHEFGMVGAGVGGGFTNTQELRVMNYAQAMATAQHAEWEEAMVEEFKKMKKMEVWQPVKRWNIPSDAKVLTSTWAMKLKSNGVKRARLVGHGFKQVDGVHYQSDNIASPVTNDVSIRIVLVLSIMADWYNKITDIKGAFLHGEFDPETPPVYMEVPKGVPDDLKDVYDEDTVLLLLKTIYGLKNASMAFWKELLQCMKSMKFRRNRSDPCLYYKWSDIHGLIVYLSWIDDCLNSGKKPAVFKESKELMRRFDCSDEGEMKEYVGMKIERTKDSIKMTQPVLLQSYRDEFKINEARSAKTQAEAGQVLQQFDEGHMSAAEQKYMRSGLGKLLHNTRWTRPEMHNATRDLSRNGGKMVPAHKKAMHRQMKYAFETMNRGWLLKPKRKWDGKDRGFEFILEGYSDSDYATCTRTRRSVTGFAVFLEGAPISAKSITQKTVALSVTEAELFAAVQCAQEMLYAMQVLEGLQLRVKKPMWLHCDNKAVSDIVNNWSVGGRTRHVQCRQYFLRQLKESNVLKVKWIPGEENCADLLTKNLPGPLFNKHIRKFCGPDEYMK